MRIAFLTKRRYMGKDVIADRYARLYEFPYQLALLGHQVLCLCLSYYGDPEGESTHEATPGALHWRSRSLGALPFVTLPAYPGRVLAELRAFAPDIVIGASDIPHVALGAWAARKLQRPFAADLYDNFESFAQARIPGATWALRRAVRQAAIVTTTSGPLATFVRAVYGAAGEVVAMPSTIDQKIFRPLDRAASRAQLGLPLHKRLIGTAGGLYRDKGVGVLYDAWRRIAAQNPDVDLVLAGPFQRSFPPPSDPRVHYLGELAHARVAELFSALDVGVVYLRDTPFGRYCFPQKVYEMLACELPVVAGNVGAVAETLATVPQSLYQPDDPVDLARCIRAQLDSPTRPSIAIDDWRQIIGALEPHLIAAASA